LLKLKQIARQLGATEGAEILEAALVLPIVFTLLLGIVAFGRAFNVYSTIQQAAQQGAITAARNSCATCGDALSGDGTVTGPAGTVAFAVATVMNASNIDPTAIKLNSSFTSPLSCVDTTKTLTCTNPGNITVCRNALLNPPISPGQPPQCGTIVSFQYPFTFYVPFTSINNSQIILSAQAQSRMEN